MSLSIPHAVAAPDAVTGRVTAEPLTVAEDQSPKLVNSGMQISAGRSSIPIVNVAPAPVRVMIFPDWCVSIGGLPLFLIVDGKRFEATSTVANSPDP